MARLCTAELTEGPQRTRRQGRTWTSWQVQRVSQQQKQKKKQKKNNLETRAIKKYAYFITVKTLERRWCTKRGMNSAKRKRSTVLDIQQQEKRGVIDLLSDGFLFSDIVLWYRTFFFFFLCIVPDIVIVPLPTLDPISYTEIFIQPSEKHCNLYTFSQARDCIWYILN